MQKIFEVESLNFEVSKKLQNLIDWYSLQQARFNYDKVQKCWHLIVIYNKKEIENDSSNIMAIDLGLDNLATLTFKENNDNYLFCGKKLKSVNAIQIKK